MNVTNSITSFNRYKLAAAVAAALLVEATPAMSQAPTLEEVIVTAQKRTQSLQDVPLSVTAVSEDSLRNAGISSIADVKTLVPNLNIYSVATPALTSITIRGAGTGATDPTLEPSVGVFVDGVFMPRSVFGLSDLVDVERIEVLMGPQGTLYGKNTNAGVISVHTKGAPTELDGNIEVAAGSDNLLETRLSVGNPITENVGFRLAGTYRERDALVENLFNGKDELDELESAALRGQLFWSATDALSFRAIGYYSNREGSMGDAIREVRPDSSMANAPFNLNTPTKFDDRAGFANNPNGGTLNSSGASLQIDYDFSNGLLLTSITAYNEWEQKDVITDSDGGRYEGLTVNDPMDESSFSQELRLTSPGGETVDWVAGAFYFSSDLHRGSDKRGDVYSAYGFDPLLNTPFVPVEGLPGLPDSPGLYSVTADGDEVLWQNNYETESIAAFAQASWNITDTTSLTAGIRYAREEKDFDMHVSVYDKNNTLMTAGSLLNIPGYAPWEGGFLPTLASGNLNEAIAGVAQGNLDAGAVNRDGSLTDSDVTGMLSLNHFIGNTMLYATVATGSKSGGFNGSFGSASSDNREYDPESSTNYEIGAKMDGLWDGRARVNMAYFYTEYEDFQAVSFDPVTVAFVVLNAGEQVTQGVDLDASIAATDTLTFTAKISYLDAEYKDYEGANCGPTSGLPQVCDLSGYRMEFAPRWAGVLSADYNQTLKNGSEIYGRLGLSFKTNHLVDPTRSSYAEDQSFEMWDGRIGWRNNSWDISVWGKNLTDETYKLFTTGGLWNNQYAQLVEGGSQEAPSASHYNHNNWVNEPRTIGMTIRYSL